MSSQEFKSFDEINRKLKKTVLFSEQARNALLTGITAIADAARVTLGPNGRAVCFGEDGAPPLLTHNGITVAENIALPDRHHNIGAQLLRQAAAATRDKAGDGSTTTVVLAQELIREGLKIVAAGANPMVFRRGLIQGAAAVQVALEQMKRSVKTMAELQQVATAAANDPEIGQLVSQMIARLGPQGFINIQDGSGLGFQIEIGSMQVFTPVQMMTQGGPARATEVTVLLMFNTTFGYFKYSYGATMAMILFFVILGLSLLQLRLLHAGEEVL